MKTIFIQFEDAESYSAFYKAMEAKGIQWSVAVGFELMLCIGKSTFTNEDDFNSLINLKP